MALITVLIADAQFMFAESLSRALAPTPDFLVFDSHPTDGAKAIDEALAAKPDIVLLDYWIGGVGGPSVIQAIKNSSQKCKVIALSWLFGPQEIESAFQAGAVGFVPKSLGVDAAAEAIRQAYRGVNPVLPEELGRVRSRLDDRSKAGLQDWEQAWERLRTLSRREIEVLEKIGGGRRVEQISEELFISTRTVRNHIHNILTKTGASTQLEAVTMARHYRLIP